MYDMTTFDRNKKMEFRQMDGIFQVDAHLQVSTQQTQYVSIYREEEYDLVLYLTYLCTNKSFPPHICHFESCLTRGVESRTVVDTDLRSF